MSTVFLFVSFLCCVFVVILFSLRKLTTRARLTASLSISVCIVSVATLVFEATKQPLPQAEPPQDIHSGSELMAKVQQALEEDPNDSKNWFTLGQYYMQLGDFASADTCFDYSIRLSNTPYAGQFAARATAKYYLEKQNLTQDVRHLLDSALTMDPLNDTALLLLASDYHLNSEYQKAIDIWMQLLDSNRQGIDRVSLIEKINQTKARL